MNIQIQQYAANMIRFLNNQSFDKSAIKTALQQLQNMTDNGTSILRQVPGQVLNEQHKSHLTWSKFAQNIKKIPRDKEPKWYR
ncbi:15874_t:CDS:2, partial [Gigaspora rosea]